tara:strand:+ start:1569 stop:1859 length:291 start_codon:yes stop_codon:yes gene_type:complete
MAQSKKTRTNIDLIQTASKIVDAMFPAGVGGRGPGAGSMPGGGTEKKGKLQKIKGKAKMTKGAKAAKVGSVTRGGRKKKGGSGGITKTRGTARASR